MKRKYIYLFLLFNMLFLFNLVGVKAYTIVQTCYYKSGSGIVTDLKVDIRVDSNNNLTSHATFAVNGKKAEAGVWNWYTPQINGVSFVAQDSWQQTKICPQYIVFDNTQEPSILYRLYMADTIATANAIKNERDKEFKKYDAYILENYDPNATTSNNKQNIEEYEEVCGFLTKNARDFIYRILDWIKYIALILAVALSILDFFKAVASEEDDAMKKAGKKLTKRIIVVVILFLLPVLLKFIFNISGIATDLCE